MPIPSSSTWEVEQWKFTNRDQVNALTDEEVLKEWRELAHAIQIFFKYRVHMTMEMSWLFSALVDVSIKRKLNLDIDGDKTGQ